MATEAEAAKFLEEYGGLEAASAAELAQHVAAAGTAEAIDILVGETRAPSTAADARALRLLYICKEAKRVLTHTEVELIFRLTLATAASTVRRMQAAYPKEVDSFLTEMVKSAEVFRAGKAGTAGRYELVFAEEAAFEQAQRILDRKGGSIDVRADRQTLTLDVPLKMKDKQGADYNPLTLLAITATPKPRP